MTIDFVPPSTFASLTLYLSSSPSRLFGRLVICRLRHIHPPREVSWEFDLPRKSFPSSTWISLAHNHYPRIRAVVWCPYPSFPSGHTDFICRYSARLERLLFKVSLSDHRSTAVQITWCHSGLLRVARVFGFLIAIQTKAREATQKVQTKEH